MFIHWRVYIILGGEWNGKTVEKDPGAWIMNLLSIPVNEYEKIAAGFNPEKFGAERIASLAKKSGMRCLAITSKHHDGFTVLRSGLTPCETLVHSKKCAG